MAHRLLCLLLVLPGCAAHHGLAGASVDLVLDHRSAYYDVGQVIGLTANVTSSAGEPIDAEVVFSVAPDSGAPLEVVDGRTASYRLDGQGQVTFTACLAGRPTVCDSVLVRVDDGAPLLELESPLPGAEVDAASGLRVKGRVVDAAPPARLFLDGAAVPLDGDGRFDAVFPSRLGIRHVELVAIDSFLRATTIELDVLSAAAFTPATDPSGDLTFTMDDAITLALGQDVFDDGVPLAPSPSPITTDVADVIALLIDRAELGSVIPRPLYASESITLYLDEPELRRPVVEISMEDGAIELFVGIGSFRGLTSGFVAIEEEQYNLAGEIDARFGASARLAIAKEGPDAEVVVALESLDLVLESLAGAFVDPETNAIFRAAAGLVIRSTLEDRLEQVVLGILSEVVPGVVREVFTGLDEALAGHSFEVDQAPLPAMTIAIDGRIRRIRTRYHDAASAPLTVSVATSAANVHPESRGFARFATTPPEPLGGGRVQIGLQLGLLNGVLHQLWSAGMLDLDVHSLLPESVRGLISEADLVPRLPPVVRPPDVHEDHDAIVSIGQLELVLLSSGKAHRFGVRLEAAVDVSIAGNVITLSIDPTPVVDVFTIEAPTPPSGLISEALVESVLTGQVWPKLAAVVEGGLSIALPIPPLDVVADVAPSLAGFELVFDETRPTLERRGDLLVADVALTGAVP